MPEPFAELTLLEQVRSYPVTILDDIQLADAAELSLLHTDCTMQVSECRAMHGRIIVKGEAVLHCLAMQEDDAVRVLNSSTAVHADSRAAGSRRRRPDCSPDDRI